MFMNNHHNGAVAAIHPTLRTRHILGFSEGLELCAMIVWHKALHLNKQSRTAEAIKLAPVSIQHPSNREIRK